jgi:hypothetical protein
LIAGVSVKVGSEVEVEHQYRRGARGVVDAFGFGGFYLVLTRPCETRLGTYEVGERVFFGSLRVMGVRLVG